MSGDLAVYSLANSNLFIIKAQGRKNKVSASNYLGVFFLQKKSFYAIKRKHGHIY